MEPSAMTAATTTVTVPPSDPPATFPLSAVPRSSVYVQNLNEKIKVPELKRALYFLFSDFGSVISVRARRTDTLRGQAWLVLQDTAAAARAVAALNGYAFYGKPLRVTFANTESHAALRARGETPQKREKRPREETAALTAAKRRKERSEQQPSAVHSAAPTATAASASVSVPPTAPNSILFIENFPSDSTAVSAVSAQFAALEGHVETRAVPNKTVAFVEFTDEWRAAAAMQAVSAAQSQQPAQHQLQISFAKR